MSQKKRNSNQEIAVLRTQKVVKANELIQKRSQLLSLQEQKIILYLISQLKPEQKDFEYQKFNIVDFCEVCGIDSNQGKNYADLKKAIKTLGDKSLWVGDDNSEILLRWINKAEIKQRKGIINIMLDPDMKPFLLELKSRYTQFDLIYTLGMKSKYSVRMYEILKSYEHLNEPVNFSLERFNAILNAKYSIWQDLKRRVIEPAVNEINKFTDISVNYTTEKKGKMVIGVEFCIKKKRKYEEVIGTRRAINEALEKSPRGEETF
jgi:plasmid replication initiation protein